MDTRDTPEYDNDTVERSVRPDNLDPRVEPEDDKGLRLSTSILKHLSNVILGFIPRIHSEHSPLLDTRDTPEYDRDLMVDTRVKPEYDGDLMVDTRVKPEYDRDLMVDTWVKPEYDSDLMVDTQVKPEYDNRRRMCFKPEYDGERCLIKGLECIENAESGVAIPYAENQLLFSIKKIWIAKHIA